jgi:hypothetical protein
MESGIGIRVEIWAGWLVPVTSFWKERKKRSFRLSSGCGCDSGGGGGEVDIVVRA